MWGLSKNRRNRADSVLPLWMVFYRTGGGNNEAHNQAEIQLWRSLCVKCERCIPQSFKPRSSIGLKNSVKPSLEINHPTALSCIVFFKTVCIYRPILITHMPLSIYLWLAHIVQQIYIAQGLLATLSVRTSASVLHRSLAPRCQKCKCFYAAEKKKRNL